MMAVPTRVSEWTPVGGGREPEANLAVYAAAAGLATAVPVPFLDRLLSGLARGSAVRRVAGRHGVRLTREARRVLGAPAPPGARGSLPRRVARAAVGRLFAPLRVAARIEDALSTYAAAIVLDHHLGGSGRTEGAPLTAPEARRVRAATESAEVAAVLATFRRAPSDLLRTLSASVRSVGAVADSDDRSPIERAVDALLDSAADAPGELERRLRDAFDRALGGESAPEEA